MTPELRRAYAMLYRARDAAATDHSFGPLMGELDAIVEIELFENFEQLQNVQQFVQEEK